MLTRVEIDGFKTFAEFTLDLRPFSAIVGPNASGKSNLFDALRFLSLLAQHDIRTAMQDLRGDPEELFRKTPFSVSEKIRFAIEVVVDANGSDAFSTSYILKTQRLRYELEISLKPRGIFVTHESCTPIAKKTDTAEYIRKSSVSYAAQIGPLIRMSEVSRGEPFAIVIRQDGENKRGRPVMLPAQEATRTALSTITTAEFPHLYALKNFLASVRFLELNPQAARKPNDRYEARALRPDASNLSAVLASLKEETCSEVRPEGVLSDISMDLASLIPSVKSIEVDTDDSAKEYSYGVMTSEGLYFSSRVISDGTLRLLALLTVLNDPNRRGLLCFEEPENGVHEGRIDALVDFLRSAATDFSKESGDPVFQVIINTHSPAVMEALEPHEIVVADTITVIDPAARTKTVKSRMRTGVQDNLSLLDPEVQLTRGEVRTILKRPSNAA